MKRVEQRLWARLRCGWSELWLISKLGQMLTTRISVPEHESGKLIIILCCLFSIMRAGMTLQDLSSPPSRLLHFLVFDTEVGLPLNLQGLVDAVRFHLLQRQLGMMPPKSASHASWRWLCVTPCFGSSTPWDLVHGGRYLWGLVALSTLPRAHPLREVNVRKNHAVFIQVGKESCLASNH